MVCFAGQIAFDCGVVRHGSLLSTRSVLISRTKMYFRQVTVFTLLLVVSKQDMLPVQLRVQYLFITDIISNCI